MRARGSSPLARGTLPDHSRCAHGVGLIPARAGNTAENSTAKPGNGAHPRSRGEHREGVWHDADGWGSSPLARGTLSSGYPHFAHVGLIPARAGNTRMNSGSAPVIAWLIPARAGNTYRVQGVSPPPWAHPRSRGEHVRIGGPDPVGLGSSPLARGTLILRNGQRTGDGLIPARAGNTPIY